ncbi:MAG UNVERIFIED_CONTAM: hypothetical protein LVR18_25155 [Planctomycetaceae bacterium]
MGCAVRQCGGVSRCRLNSVSPNGDGVARRWGATTVRVISAVTRGEFPPLAAEVSKVAIPSALNPAAPEGDRGEGNAEGNSPDAGSSKETSYRRSCRGRKQASAAGGRRAAEIGSNECAVSTSQTLVGGDRLSPAINLQQRINKRLVNVCAQG